MQCLLKLEQHPLLTTLLPPVVVSYSVVIKIGRFLSWLPCFLPWSFPGCLASYCGRCWFNAYSNANWTSKGQEAMEGTSWVPTDVFHLVDRWSQRGPPLTLNWSSFFPENRLRKGSRSKHNQIVKTWGTGPKHDPHIQPLFLVPSYLRYLFASAQNKKY